ncbi:adhesion G-protein coupled receptor G6-like isoform X2 [Cololabis saira]|uniref:adhesion G-protein coupled receptor G6-like isoform X2 n=1 Tax=Cololabis saira TaxID=129043 RepID=UPI002AD4BF9D|nr:adhesion G-protein coupled receptor G6-like isoform X2 [Cololabis saira]
MTYMDLDRVNTSFIPQIWLPVNALHALPEDERVIGVVHYMENGQFQVDNDIISSMAIRIEVLGQRRLQGLNPPITMIFRAQQENIDNESQLLCHYLNEDGTYLDWRTDGCETLNDTDKIICNCNHTTPFAVLLARDPIAQVHWNILSILSNIGCGLSAFFSALSIVIYLFSRKHKFDHSISIHVSLSGALLLLNVTFLLTNWEASVETEWVCVFLAASMHYSLMCSFTWMALEALHLYFLMIKVFNTDYQHYMLKLSVAGWGIPGVIVVTTLAVKDVKQFYGVVELSLSDTDQTNAICWITDDVYFYSLNVVYFAIIFLFNSGILVVVASRIWKMRQITNYKPKSSVKTKENPPPRSRVSCKTSITLMSLTCLLGTTWGLAFLGSGYVNYPILYLFCILNSLQGFFIFLWICLSTKKQREREMEEKLSTPVRISGTKSE